MKNSKEHAQRLLKLYRALKRAYPKVEKTTYEDPAEALICGIISENMSESAAQKAIKEIRASFVEALGEDTASSRATAFALASMLRGVFDEHHKISLQSLKKLGKRPAKQGIERFDGVSRFAVNYCMLTSLQAHAIPLTGRMIEYLKKNEIVDANADEEDVEGFLTRQIAAKDAYEFYALLRHESESSKARKRATTRPKARTPRAKAKK
jgi:endonuclease III